MTEQEALARKRSSLELRSLVLQSIRTFFSEQGFLEVQTPVRTAFPAPEAHIDAIRVSDGTFLITSPELYMKRLLAAGYERIYQITPVFRGAEQGRLHHPEFSLLEWYRLGADYTALQTDCENLLRYVVQAVGQQALMHHGQPLDVFGEWPRIIVKEAFRRYAGWEPDAESDSYEFDRDLVERVEPQLGFPCPCFLMDYPSNQAALARIKLSDPSVAERFELYWAGIELANAFSELTDAAEQRRRFESVLELQRMGGRVPYPMPENFLESMEHLMASAGIAFGIDRLVMLLAGADGIDEVVAFPPSLL